MKSTLEELMILIVLLPLFLIILPWALFITMRYAKDGGEYDKRLKQSIQKFQEENK